MEDARIIIIGFLFVHVLSTMFLMISLTAPVLAGLTGVELADSMIILSLGVAFRFQFPIALLFSLAGSAMGAFLGEKLRVSD